MLFSQSSKATSRAVAQTSDMRKKKSEQKMDNRMARTFVDNVIETSQQEIDRSLVVSEDMRSDFASKADNQL